MPSLVALAVEPVLGVVAVTRRRQALIVAGGACFAGGLALAAGARSAWVLLAGFAILYPASGAFVGLSQASLMDLEPERREHNMARWTLAGAVGALAGPLLLGAFAWAGLGWRGLFAGAGLLALGLLARRLPDNRHDGARPRVRDALKAIARREVIRWLFLLELSDLMLGILPGFLSLYVVDAAGASPAAGALAVAIWTAAGLVGSAGTIPLLSRTDGLRYLRASAAGAAALFVGFLLAPPLGAKLALAAAIAFLTAGWYPVLQARLYAALGAESGLVLTVGALFPLNAVLPLAIGGLAARWGVGAAFWPLLAAPAVLLLLGPRRRT